MGKVVVKVKMTNAEDIAVADRGFMLPVSIRSLEVEGIVDTGARMLSVPEDIAQQLGLTVRTYKPVRYAGGQSQQCPVAGTILLEIQGRDAQVECLIQPAGAPVLIGQIPLEALDWNVDVQRQCLIPAHEGYEQGLIEMY